MVLLLTKLQSLCHFQLASHINWLKKLADLRKSGEISYLRPDAKSQVTVEYDENDQPVRVDTVVISTQHDPEATNDQIRQDVIEKVIKQLFQPNTWMMRLSSLSTTVVCYRRTSRGLWFDWS